MTMQISNENSLIDDAIRRIRSGNTVEFEYVVRKFEPIAGVACWLCTAGCGCRRGGPAEFRCCVLQAQ